MSFTAIVAIACLSRSISTSSAGADSSAPISYIPIGLYVQGAAAGVKLRLTAREAFVTYRLVRPRAVWRFMAKQVAKRRTRAPDATREKLLRSAFDEIYRRGFQAASLDAILTQ